MLVLLLAALAAAGPGVAAAGPVKISASCSETAVAKAAGPLIDRAQGYWARHLGVAEFTVSLAICGHLNQDRRQDMAVALTLVNGTGGSPKPWGVLNQTRDGGFRLRHTDLGRRPNCLTTLRIAERRLTILKASEYFGAWTICDRKLRLRWAKGAYRSTSTRAFKRCDPSLVYVPRQNGAGLIVLQLRAAGLTCRRALRVAGSHTARTRAGWNCLTSVEGDTRCLHSAGRWITYRLGGSAH